MRDVRLLTLVLLISSMVACALVHADGSVDCTQLPHVVRDAEVEAGAILAVMKKASPGQARVQAIAAPGASA